MTHFGGRGRAPRGFWSTPICQLSAPPGAPAPTGSPTGRPTALPPLRAGHRQCGPLAHFCSSRHPTKLSQALSSVRESAAAPTEAPSLLPPRHTPHRGSFPASLDLQSSSDPPAGSDFPPCFILASRQSDRGRSFPFLPSVFFRRGGFPYPESGHVPSFR